MAPIVLTNCQVWTGGYDLTSEANQISISAKVDDQDTTTFSNSGYKTRVGGLKDIEANCEGLYNAAPALASQDLDAFSKLGVPDEVFTAAPDAAQGSIAYMFQAGRFSYEFFGPVGEVAPFKLQALGTNNAGVIRGQNAAPKASVNATGALGGAGGVQLGLVGAAQFLYAGIHVFSAGTTITVQVQSDDNSGFSSATTRGTIGPITATGGYWMTRVAGAIATDTFWRFNVSAITGTFSIAGAIGIQ